MSTEIVVFGARISIYYQRFVTNICGHVMVSCVLTHSAVGIHYECWPL
jgi:hypothetical protein